MSGKSLVIAITVANVVINLAMKETLGDHLNVVPMASFTAKYTPKFSKNPRTVAIVNPASIGFCLVLNGGTEYIAPSVHPTIYNLNSNAGKNLKLQHRIECSNEKEFF